MEGSLWIVLALAPLLAGCAIPDPPPVQEPRELVPPVAGGPIEEEGEVDATEGGASDHWIETYGGYFSREQRKQYLATPPAARLEKFGLFLLDLRLREDLLAASQDVLTREEIEAFRRLPGLTEARAFVDERRRRAARQATHAEVDDHHAEPVRGDPRATQFPPTGPASPPKTPKESR